ncbi:SIS domain-containing protein [Clostridium sp. M62/1]|uniref:KpsF/GutQ family sugar-phosphate isomerase n=1 Tax=Clostridium sp. M62/1 TaxID=411486 RepID=UPI003564385D
MDKLSEGKRVFNIEIEALQKTRDALDDTFVQILDLVVNCKGKVIVTGMGKSGHIASKIAATFASLGSSSFYLHPAEAMHGDLGMISSNDVVIAISYSGESDEIVKILPNIKMIGATLVGITGNGTSTLASTSDITQVLPNFNEACYLGLAPTSSTTAVLCYGDALAVVASGIYGFKDSDFGKFHPAGSLGKKLIITVDDLMAKDADNAIVKNNSTLTEAIVELSKKGLGIVSIVDNDNILKGVITDGDLRRQLEKGVDIYSLTVNDIMSKNPITIECGKLAVVALNTMREKNISCMPVVKSRKIVGTIRMHTIIDKGIF